MSQSNSKEKTAKKTFYFLVIFTIVCIGVTYACIYKTLEIRNIEAKKKHDTLVLQEPELLDVNMTENKSSSKKDFEPVSLAKKYKSNALDIETIEKKEGKIIYDADNGTDATYEYEISYDQISGLKDKSIEDKINKEIKEKAFSLKQKLVDNPKFDMISISANVEANYCDVLSVMVVYNLRQKVDDITSETPEDDYGYIGLNYRLDTGEYLKFNNLFNDDVNIKSILQQCAYKSLIWNFYYDGNMENYDFNEVDYGIVENQVFKVLSSYSKNPDIDFYFWTDTIYINIKGYDIQMPMRDYYNSIAVYTKYKADGLYEDDSKSVEFYAFTPIFLVENIKVEETKGNNFYYEILNYATEEPKNKELEKVASDDFNSKIEYYYNIAKKNPDKGYLFSMTEEMHLDEDGKYYMCMGYVCETDIDYFKEHKEEIISEARMHLTPDISPFDFSEHNDNVEFYESFYKSIEDYKTGEAKEQITTKEEREAMEQEL